MTERKTHTRLTPEQKLAIAQLYMKHPKTDRFLVAAIADVDERTVRNARDEMLRAAGFKKPA